MTRFARARGSKASNERTPEDSTPWEVMKEQLLQAKQINDDSKKRQEAEQKRIENYENFLKEQKTQKRKATWCDFPENEKKAIVPENSEPPAKSKKKNKNKKSASVPDQLEPANDKNNEDQQADNVDGPIKKSKKKNKKPRTEKTSQDEIRTPEGAQNQSDQNNKQTKKKNHKKEHSQSKETFSNSQIPPNSNQQGNSMKTPISSEQKSKKKKKLIDGKPMRRKEVDDRSFQLIINGKEIELVRFDGFPVMKKDAERLQELKDNMIKKGIPKSEVQRTIKLERRRAEKALARVKRDVCYNCRKGGHVLSDCPELKSKIPGADGADGVCFKCGSTEHRQFECKVQKGGDKEFRFATCFICKEPGHIARQCPDNPKGLYPNGGSCKLCGDVTHLRKDCPTVMDKKEGSTVKLQTLDSNENLEDVGSQLNKSTTSEINKKPKKIRF